MITDFPPDISVDPPPAELPLILTFNDINNFFGVADVNNVNDWNTFLVASGNPYTSVTVTGNVVELYGGSNVVIGDSLFVFDSTLVSVYDTNTVVRLGTNGGLGLTFWGASALTTVEMAAVETISISTFLSSTLVTGAFASVTTIYDGAFSDCVSMTTLTIESVITLHESAISNTGLVSLIIPNCIETVGAAIASNGSLTTIDVSGVILWGSITACPLVIDVQLPLCTTLGNGGTSAFNNMAGLQTVSAPLCTSVAGLSPGVYGGFTACDALTDVYLPLCASFGSTTGDDSVFFQTNGVTCTLTVPVSLQTADGGNPDGDLVTFLANNPASNIVYV